MFWLGQFCLTDAWAWLKREGTLDQMLKVCFEKLDCSKGTVNCWQDVLFEIWEFTLESFSHEKNCLDLTIIIIFHKMAHWVTRAFETANLHMILHLVSPPFLSTVFALNSSRPLFNTSAPIAHAQQVFLFVRLLGNPINHLALPCLRLSFFETLFLRRFSVEPDQSDTFLVSQLDSILQRHFGTIALHAAALIILIETVLPFEFLQLT